MNTHFEDKRKAAYSSRRSVMDIGMGLIIAGFGVFFLVAPRMGWMQFNLDPLLRYLFSGLCLLYGGFRIYRGFQKNYFRE